jgi:hypothetical protein
MTSPGKEQMPQVDVEELERLEAKATPGRWETTGSDIWIDTREQVCCGNFRCG